ncbi:MAG: serine dehydratase [Bacteroidales bacterium]|nr:serine dehydratase [Bacteroidales bacterium]
MKSIKEIYKIGKGPSSSHTMGPLRASKIFRERYPEASRYEVTLYGSLAATGKGHLTDTAILEGLESEKTPVEIIWRAEIELPRHPNGMRLQAYNSEGKLEGEMTVYSTGGGAIEIEGEPQTEGTDIYGMTTMTEILNYCRKTGLSYWEYVEETEGSSVYDHLSEVWEAMKSAVEAGLAHEGRLPGPLNLRRKAPSYHVKATGYRDNIRSRGLVFAYALAVSEENAGGGRIVTAPTCGSCGVLPGVLYHLWSSRGFPETRVLHALATAGLVGNIVKENASISGAEVGCQGEVGVACAMAAAAASQLFGGSVAQIEYAAEMGLEHHLGMTCDPVCGLVQIPCIERNAYAAARALDANIFSNFTDGSHRVSFDRLIQVMKETGKDLPSLYRETGTGGLAKDYEQM